VPEPPRPAPLGQLLETDRNNDAVIRLVIGQGRLLTTKAPLVQEGGAAVIAVGDPSIVDFEILPNPRMIRLLGKRAGVTDLTFVTSDDQINVFEVHVQYDLDLLHAHLRRVFPDSLIQVSQLREHLIIEGQARGLRQAQQVEQAVRSFLLSAGIALQTGGDSGLRPEDVAVPESPLTDEGAAVLEELGVLPRAGLEQSERPELRAILAEPQIINLMTVPGVQQVLLQVRVAELNRTGMREIGADTFFEFGPGNILGTRIGGANVDLTGLTPGSTTTGFGIFPNARVEIILRALREASLIRVLAEPNLVALSGHEASFLAGGEFPVPVPQGTTGFSNVTVRFKEFGVQLNFVPYILDDEAIRLEVRPEVSTIDESLGTTLVVGGDPVPGINTRRVHTTVELRQGESLALAGLLQVAIDGDTKRIPGLGDLPIIGPLFSNTTHKRVEKELLVLVTPYLVSPMQPHEVGQLPGDEVEDPDDHEFYLLNRIEGRTGGGYRSTVSWDDPLGICRRIKREREQIHGPGGFSR
jgi:pilus assembly protein CpaC